MSRELVSPAFRQLMTLAATGATGKQTDIADVEWQSVVCRAQEQSVLSLVGVALMKHPDIKCPELLREQLLSAMRKAAEKDIVRKLRTLHLLAEMKEAGIDVHLIKGYPIADCYAFPESRSSVDTDILSPPEQENQTCDFLRSKGFHIDMRGRTEHHDEAQHRMLGVVEVHVTLYSELQQEIWFHDAEQDALPTEAPVQAITLDMPYTTLGYTDHLIFLTLHAIKHFICTGMGLRMMLDIALFFAKYKEQIDLQRYWRLMENLKFTTLVSSILWAMIDTKCFDRSDFPGLPDEKPEGINLFLKDMETGGHMGGKEGEQRFDGSYEYSRQVMLRTMSPIQYRIHILRQKMRDAEKQMFPEKERLTNLYPIIAKKSWLALFCRLHRMFAYPIQKIRAGELKKQVRTNSAKMPEEARQRVEMFKKLGMI